MDSSEPARPLLDSLRERGLTVELRRPDDPAAKLRLIVGPGSALTDADRAALKEHKDALLDLLWEEQSPLYEPGQDFTWPADHPRWNGTEYDRPRKESHEESQG